VKAKTCQLRKACESKPLAFINKPLLYHDMEQECSDQYYPPEVLEDISFFSQFTKQGHLEVTGIPEEIGGLQEHYLTSPHLVFDMGEMVRYICFRVRLREAKAASSFHSRIRGKG